MNQVAAAAQVINTRAEGPTYTMGLAAARPGPCSAAGAAAVMDGPALANMSSTISAQTERSWCSEGAAAEVKAKADLALVLALAVVGEEVAVGVGRGRLAAGEMRLFMNQRGGMSRWFQRGRRSITSSWSCDQQQPAQRTAVGPELMLC